MGFLKKFFSIGSRKSKKPRAPSPPTQEPRQDDRAEVEVCRLLRSSSGRCVSESQTGLASLPPLPHPINSVIPHPKSSSTTIASVSARSTYSVVIRSRTVHSRTVFPNAYPPTDTPKRSLADSPRRRSKSVPITPRDKNRLTLLRQDPSVASLLNHYDDRGHLDSALFSNSPSPRKEGQVQRRRTGSTLRQLLGHPSSPGLRNSTEGDISWAEKFLGETDGNSSVSSIGPQTPVDTHFPYAHSIDDKSIECDTSTTNQPTFSSLEVELSASTDQVHSQGLNSPNGTRRTPQRASEIFGFLGDKKRACDGPASRLPQPKTITPSIRRFSAESSISDTKHSQIPLPRRSNTYAFQPISPTNRRRFSVASDTSRSPPSSPITALFLPTQPEGDVVSQRSGQCGRSPSGPRLPCKIPSRHSARPLSSSSEANTPRPAIVQPVSSDETVSSHAEHTGDKDMVVAVSRTREMHSQIPKLRSTSGSSSCSTGSKHDVVVGSPCRHPIALQPGVPRRSGSMEPASLMNLDVFSRLPQPVTPVRPFGRHSLHLREPPSPASSSELSPVAKQMMANLRQQRMHARQRERQSGRLGSSQSRIRY